MPVEASRMPTAGRLVGAVFFGVLTWYVTEIIKLEFPPDRNLGRFSEVNAFIGALCGWFLMGPRTGDGYAMGIGYGLTTSAMIVFWGLFLQCFGEMIRQSIRRAYDGAMEGVMAVFQMMVDYGSMMLTPQIVGTLIVGGVVGGIVAEWFGARYS